MHAGRDLRRFSQSMAFFLTRSRTLSTTPHAPLCNVGRRLAQIIRYPTRRRGKPGFVPHLRVWLRHARHFRQDRTNSLSLRRLTSALWRFVNIPRLETHNRFQAQLAGDVPPEEIPSCPDIESLSLAIASAESNQPALRQSAARFPRRDPSGITVFKQVRTAMPGCLRAGLRRGSRWPAVRVDKGARRERRPLPGPAEHGSPRRRDTSRR